MSEKPTDESVEVAEPTSNDQGADDLETLLSEYESSVPKEEPKQPEPQADVDPVQEWARSRMELEAKQEYQRGVEESVSSIRKELGEVNVSDTVIEGLLHVEATKDPRVGQAFNNRGQNPEAWNKILKGLAGKYKADFSIDPGITQDKAAISAAVRGASSSKPAQDDAPDFSKMSDAEFQRYASQIR